MSVAARRSVHAALVTAALAATGLAVAPVAQAGPPGTWTRLTTSTGIHTDTHPSLVRLGTKLEVVWNQVDSSGLESVRSRGVSLAGHVESTTHAIVTGWSSIANDPAAISEKGHLLVVVGGVRTASPSETYKGRLAFATSSDAAHWSLQPDLLTQTANAAGANGIAAVEDGGAPTVAAAINGAHAITYNHGIPGGTDKTTSASGGEVQATALARDAKTGAVWAAWYDGSTAHQGIWYQQIYPTRGTLRRAVGSYSSAGSVVPPQEVAMTTRAGGGVYLAYDIGATPSSVKKIRVLKAANSGSSYHDVAVNGATDLALTAGVGGRIWLAWYDSLSGRVRAVRSNKTVSRFSTGVAAVGPTYKQGYSVDQVSIDGSKGPLDVVVTADVPNHGYQALYHTQLYAPLVVRLSKSSVKSSTGGSVTVTVTEAGSPLAGVSVSFGGHVVHTNSHGKATVHVAKHAAKGKKTVAVSLTYYVTKRVTLRVT